MSTFSSANITDGNLVLKERTYKIKIKYSMHQYSIRLHNLGNWLILSRLSFPASKWPLKSSYGIWESDVSPPVRENDIAATRHVSWSLNIPKICVCGRAAFSGACKCRPISVKRNVKAEAIMWLTNFMCDYYFLQGDLTPKTSSYDLANKSYWRE